AQTGTGKIQQRIHCGHKIIRSEEVEIVAGNSPDTDTPATVIEKSFNREGKQPPLTTVLGVQRPLVAYLRRRFRNEVAEVTHELRKAGHQLRGIRTVTCDADHRGGTCVHAVDGFWAGALFDENSRELVFSHCPAPPESACVRPGSRRKSVAL